MGEKGPTQRTALSSAGGTPNGCDGRMSVKWNALQIANPLSRGNPWSAGEGIFNKTWYRDPDAPKTANLSVTREMKVPP